MDNTNEIRMLDRINQEYDMLHDEIKSNTDSLFKITCFFLPVAITILTLALQVNHGFIALFNIPLVIAMVNKIKLLRLSTMKNATYCEVFLDSSLNRKWETRLRKLEHKANSETKVLRMAYPGFLEWILIEIMSIIVFISKEMAADGIIEILILIIGVVFGISMLIYTICVVNSVSDVGKMKQEYIQYWKEIEKDSGKR